MSGTLCKLYAISKDDWNLNVSTYDAHLNPHGTQIIHFQITLFPNNLHEYLERIRLQAMLFCLDMRGSQVQHGSHLRPHKFGHPKSSFEVTKNCLAAASPIFIRSQ